MNTHFLLYRSKARRKIQTETIVDILAKSIRNNREEGLTGFLHTYDDQFPQYLEGPQGPLMRKVARIQKDRRHTDFLILAEGEVEERLFPDWEMGQIADLSWVFDGAQENQSWFASSTPVNPVPLLQAVAAHAGKSDLLEVSEE